MIVEAVKLPDASRATIADAVFALVAVVAELDTLPLVDIVDNLLSTIAAPDAISASTINDDVNNPAALLCIIPAVENPLIVMEPDELIFNL